jgi:hypothetical protein
MKTTMLEETLNPSQNAQLMERSRSMHTTTNDFMQLIPQYLLKFKF